jgi:hypothetical protein
MTKTKQFRIFLIVPKAPTRRLYGIKITKIHEIENLTLGHLQVSLVLLFDFRINYLFTD